MKSRRLPIIPLLLFAVTSWAQNAESARVTFALEWQEGSPKQYTVVLDRDGHADYRSQDTGLSGSQAENKPVESNREQAVQQQDAASQGPFETKFQATPRFTDRVFELAKLANHFRGSFEYRKGKIAFTGVKTLMFDTDQEHDSTSFNWSDDPSIQELTKMFQGLSQTLEQGRKLEFSYRYSKLALDADLTTLEQLSKDGMLQQVQAIAPVLRRIAADRTVLHMAQERAQRLLKKAGEPVPATAQ